MYASSRHSSHPSVSGVGRQWFVPCLSTRVIKIEKKLKLVHPVVDNDTVIPPKLCTHILQQLPLVKSVAALSHIVKLNQWKCLSLVYWKDQSRQKTPVQI